MPEDNTGTNSTQTTSTTPPTVTDNTPVVDVPDPASEQTEEPVPVPPAKEKPTTNYIPEIIEKINESHNILIALSSDPSVDEMATAIGLSLFLDKLDKRATSIYSGQTPNALEFLKPEETFEPTVDSLQDFVIALNKDKADHLRYKLDGDFVKVYITPYKTRISEKDLDYSYGDFNVDLVIALNVANGIDLDTALREHGRIMHDAVIINITTGNPGKLGEIEWSDKTASSVSEMVSRLLYEMEGEAKIENEEATAFLTGIVAATSRFSNNRTTAECMQVASRLMESGADQQLISKNITADTQNEVVNLLNNSSKKTKPKEEDLSKMDIKHEEKLEEEPKEEEKVEEPAEEPVSVPEPIAEPVSSPASTEEEPEKEALLNSEINDTGLLDDLKAAEESLSRTGAETTPQPEPELVKIDSKQEKVLQPSLDAMSTLTSETDTNKYGQMLEDALSSIDDPAPAPVDEPMVSENPAVTNAPTVPTNPEVNGVPEINYMPLPGDEVLPPPPTPPINMSGELPAPTPVQETVVPSTPVEPIVPASPASEPEPTSLGSQPAMQDQIYAPQVSDPGAFQIPGM